TRGGQRGSSGGTDRGAGDRAGKKGDCGQGEEARPAHLGIDAPRRERLPVVAERRGAGRPRRCGAGRCRAGERGDRGRAAVHRGEQQAHCGPGGGGETRRAQGGLMGVTERLWRAFTSVIELEGSVTRQADALKAQQTKIEDLTARVIRLETQLELLLGAAMIKKLKGQ